MFERRYDFFRNNHLQCVYVIYNAEFKRAKIGITDNIKNRITSLVGATGCKLEVVYKTPYIRNASKLEKIAHSHFNDFRLIGEWFDIRCEEAVAFLKRHLPNYIQKDEYDFYKFIEEEKKNNVNVKNKRGCYSCESKEKPFDNKIKQVNRKMEEDYPIGESMILDRPLSKFKRIDKHLYKDNKERIYEIWYINKQWLMKRLK